MATRPQHSPAYRRLRDLLRGVRDESGLTLRDLGRAMRIHHTMVHRIETGDRRIDPVEFVSWCRACGADPAQLIRILERATR